NGTRRLERTSSAAALARGRAPDQSANGRQVAHHRRGRNLHRSGRGRGGHGWRDARPDLYRFHLSRPKHGAPNEAGNDARTRPAWRRVARRDSREDAILELRPPARYISALSRLRMDESSI